jgi:ubiquinone/menaquinone biosynthesis C-methylase UbiE
MEKRNFDVEATTWDEEPRRVQLAKDLFLAISEEIVLTPSMDALDFGCGTGLVTLPLSAHAGRVTGVDSSGGMLDVLERKIQTHAIENITTHRVDLDCGDVLDGLYDLVVSTMTLHHIREVMPLLEQFAQVLKPGGRVCIADLDLENGEFHGNNEGVFHFGFDRTVLKKSLLAAGFVDVTDRTAAKVLKPGADGKMKDFPVFLITGTKLRADHGQTS